MGKPSQDKDARVECAMAKRHLDICVHSVRVPLSSEVHQQGYSGDIVEYAFSRGEVPEGRW